MLKGLYTAAAGMLATNMATDTLADNLANINTVGYKGSKMNFQTFAEMLINRIDDQGQNRIGSITMGSKVYGSYINFKPGAMHETGNTFDLALNGDGFFTVKDASGKTFYTRAGNFTVDSQGFLTTLDGMYVQGKLGNIQMNLDEIPININTKGEVTGKGRSIDQLQITRFTDNQSLDKVSDNLYQETPSSKKLPDPTATGGQAGFTVTQGALEESNVSPVSELINNIEGLRLYEALQKNIHMHNEALGKAVNDVGRYK
jgi:flagellar basal-body rod protein FlgG